MAVGFSVNTLVAGASTNAVLVKAAPGVINGWHFQNSAAYAVYFKLYNSATIPTAGAGTPVMTIGIAPGSSQGVTFGNEPVAGFYFNAGIGFTITKLAAANDTTVLVAADCVTNLFYN
jgi:hypothetical protein